ncbi:MAG: glycosyltransferase family 39 protein [Acidobacteriota bacterium]
MPFVLPLLALAFLTAGFHRRNSGWRESLLFASIPWALFLALITEILTQFRHLTRAGVAFSWLGFAIVCLVWMRRAQKTEQVKVNPDKEAAPLQWMEWVGLAAIAGLLSLTALTALISAPNTWDAMLYHLPRVVEWINNRGVQFYPTIDRFQLDQPPFAEYVMLHLYLLYGSDRLVDLVQWCGYAGCIAAVSLIAKELGGSRRSQVVAAVLCATIPTAVLEASGTKTELVATYWVVVAVYLLLKWRKNQTWALALAIGTTLGLAVFTKGTSYVFLPCIVLACAATWSRTELRRFATRLPGIAAIGILVCAPMWVRNYQYAGSPLGLPYFDGAGSQEGRLLKNTHITPAAIVANMTRNVALHVGTPSEVFNAKLTTAFSQFIRATGINPDDPGQLSATSFGNTPRFEVRFHPRYEVLAGDPLPFLLLLMGAAVFVAHRGRFTKSVGWLGLGLLGAFVLYSALLRWSQWNARYQIPILVLGIALSAVVLVPTLPRRAVDFIVAISVLLAIPLALANETRPLITKHGLHGSILTTPREQTYFLDFHQESANSFIAAAEVARASGCHSVGLDATLMRFEYPVMALVTQGSGVHQIEYVGVENSTTQYARPGAAPVCMVICLNCRNAPAKIAEYSRELPNAQYFGDVVLFGESAQ